MNDRVYVHACTEADIFDPAMWVDPEPWWQLSPHLDCAHDEFDLMDHCRLCARDRADCEPEWIGH